MYEKLENLHCPKCGSNLSEINETIVKCTSCGREISKDELDNIMDKAVDKFTDKVLDKELKKLFKGF